MFLVLAALRKSGSTRTGAVGIGTSSPTAPLHVNSSSHPQIKFGGDSPLYYWGLDREPSAGDLQFTNANNSAEVVRMTITAAGNVGIGTTSPVYKIDGGFANQTWGWYLNTSYNSGFTYNTTERSLLIHTKSSENIDHIKFATGGAATERMRIESGGALLVTSNDIKSSISGAYYLFGANGTAGSPAYVTYSFVNDPNTGMYRGGADTLAFATAGSRRMTIDPSGNLLVGSSSARC